MPEQNHRYQAIPSSGTRGRAGSSFISKRVAASLVLVFGGSRCPQPGQGPQRHRGGTLLSWVGRAALQSWEGWGMGKGGLMPPSGLGRHSVEPKRFILQPKELLEFALLGFGLAQTPSALPCFIFLHFGVGMSVQCLSHYCILESHYLSVFTDSQLERNLV